MRPNIQSNNIKVCNISSRNMSINWSPGDGDSRIVVVSKERSTSAEAIPFPINNSVYPDPNRVRMFWPGYNPFYKTYGGYLIPNSYNGWEITNPEHMYLDDPHDTKGKISGTNYNCKMEYLPPLDSLPEDNVYYDSSVKYGYGDEVLISEIGMTNSNLICGSTSSGTSSRPYVIPTDSSSDSYVVYNGSGYSVDVIGLSPNTGYYIYVYDYNNLGDCILYNYETSYIDIVTSSEIDCSTICVYTSSCRTTRALMGTVHIYNRMGKLVDFGDTDKCGLYESSELSVGSYKIVVSVSGYEEQVINNAHIKRSPPKQTSVLQNNWSMGTYPTAYNYVYPKDRRDNTYHVKF